MKKLNSNFVPVSKSLANAAASGALEQLAITAGASLSGGGGGTSYEQAATVNTWFGLPTGNTAQRTSSANGALRLNTETNYVEIFYGNTWFNLNYLGGIVATGGTITTEGSYKIHTFTTSGIFTLYQAPFLGEIEYLAVGGGGGASGGTSGVNFGAGAAGGVLRSGTVLAPGQSNVSYTITVGAGGSASVGTAVAGGSSIISGEVTATGGGAAPSTVRNGGSNADYAGGGPNGPFGAGGGAGAGGNGGIPPGTNNGGIGATSSISGVLTYYGGGGGGGNNPSGTGGLGGGGPFGGVAGTTNTGGGGGGSSYSPATPSGSGGSGIVILKYRFQ